MNQNQKLTIVVSLIALFAMILVPPWKGGQYSLLFDPPTGDAQLDFTRLLVQGILLITVCATFFLILKPSTDEQARQLSENDGTKTTSDHTLLKRAGMAFTAILILVMGWHFFCEYQERLLAKQEQLLAEQKAENARQEWVRYQAQQNKIATEQALAQQKANQEQEAAWAQRLAKAGTPKTWPLPANYGEGIRANLITYWKDEQLVYKLVLEGSPESLEYAAAARPTTGISLLNADGLMIGNITVESSALQSYKNNRGAITRMSSPPQTLGSSLDAYEAVVKVRMEG